MSTKAIIQRLDGHIRAMDLESMAYETGFMVRTPRKVSPVVYIRAFCLNAAENMAATFSHYAAQLSLLAKTIISKQAVADKIKQPAIDFLKKFYWNCSNHLSPRNGFPLRNSSNILTALLFRTAPH